MYVTTPQQTKTIHALEAAGFKFASWIRSHQDPDPMQDPRSAVLTRKRKNVTRIAACDPDGTVNGRSIAEYLADCKAAGF